MRTGPLVPFSLSLVSLSAGGSSLCAVLCRLHWGKSLKRIKKETGREGEKTAAQQPPTVTVLDKSMAGCSCSKPRATLAWQQGTAALQWFTGSGGGRPASTSAGAMVVGAVICSFRQAKICVWNSVNCTKIDSPVCCVRQWLHIPAFGEGAVQDALSQGPCFSSPLL